MVGKMVSKPEMKLRVTKSDVRESYILIKKEIIIIFYLKILNTLSFLLNNAIHFTFTFLIINCKLVPWTTINNKNIRGSVEVRCLIRYFNFIRTEINGWSRRIPTSPTPMFSLLKKIIYIYTVYRLVNLQFPCFANNN